MPGRLGGAPLAIGTIYLLFGRLAGHIAVVLLLGAVGVTSIFVILSPLRMELVDPKMLNGKALAWQSIRIGEFIGVILIWIGYKYCQQPLDSTNLGLHR